MKDYETLVEQSLTGIYIDQGGKIAFANERFAEIYEDPLDELLGMESRELVHPEDRPLTDKMRAKRIKGKTVPQEHEARGLTRKGEMLWVRRRNTKISYKGKSAILGNVVDISRQKAEEEELLRVNKDMKNLLQVVSHDLRTPVISMQGLASRLLKSHKRSLDPKGTVRDFYGALKEDTSRQPAVFHMDEPPVLLGNNQGTNPVEYLLVALSGCPTTSLVAHASAKGIKIRGVQSRYEGDIDLQGFLGLSEAVPVGYQEIRVYFKIDADVSEQEKEDMVKMAQKYSPVFNTITKSAPVSVSLDKS